MDEKAPKEHKNQVFPELGFSVCKWPVREKVSWGQINIYPGLLKCQEGKDGCMGCGGELGVGIREGFIGRHLTLVRTNPESGQIKA